jgi:hypothetical protein
VFALAVGPKSQTDKSWAWERRTLGQKIITRATADAEFMEQLKADPHGTIEREFHMRIRDGCEVTVLEESQDLVYIVLPVQSSGYPRG